MIRRLLALALLQVCSATSTGNPDAPIHSTSHRCCVGQDFRMGAFPTDMYPFYTYTGTWAGEKYPHANQYGGFFIQVIDKIGDETGASEAALPDGNSADHSSALL